MKQHFIYVIGRQEGPVKVGITSSLNARLATLQTGCHFELDLFYYRECRDREHARYHEANVHYGLGEKRLAGEWFDVDVDLAAQLVDTSMDLEIWFAHEAEQERISAQLNIWPWAGEDHGAHPNH